MKKENTIKATNVANVTINDLTIDRLIENGVNLDMVRELIKLQFYDFESQIRTAMILNGTIELPDEDDIPKESFVGYGSSRTKATFRRYNILTNFIEYTYEDVATIYFRTEEDAKSYSKTGDHYRYNCRKEQSEEFNHSGTYTYIRSSSINLETWIANTKA